MSDYSTLVSAISDVGYWRWWTEKLPDLFQLEFGGVQIYVPPDDKSQPPSSLLALRFFCPSKICFIQRESINFNSSFEWVKEIKEDKIGPFYVNHDEFALGDDEKYDDVLKQVGSEMIHFNDSAGGKNVKFAFWAGDVGIAIEAAEVRPVLIRGEIQLSDFSSLHSAWWDYWRDYWSKKETADAYPKDFACEVTIPIKSE